MLDFLTPFIEPVKQTHRFLASTCVSSKLCTYKFPKMRISPVLPCITFSYQEQHDQCTTAVHLQSHLKIWQCSLQRELIVGVHPHGDLQIQNCLLFQSMDISLSVNCFESVGRQENRLWTSTHFIFRAIITNRILSARDYSVQFKV